MEKLAGYYRGVIKNSLTETGCYPIACCVLRVTYLHRIPSSPLEDLGDVTNDRVPNHDSKLSAVCKVRLARAPRYRTVSINSDNIALHSNTGGMRNEE